MSDLSCKNIPASFAVYLRTVRHLRACQVTGTLKESVCTPIERLLPRFFVREKQLPRDGITPLRALLPRPYADRAYCSPHRYYFLSKEIDTNGSWFPEGASLLWLFHLHYFDYLFELSDSRVFSSLIDDWIEKVPKLHRVAWHPYPLSLRLGNWIWNYSRFEPEFETSFRDRFLSSVGQQLDFLQRHLEYRLLGNHLIENCKALVIAGIFLGDAAAQALGTEILESQLKEQVLADGGHYERSPTYHTLVLAALLEIHHALRQAGHLVPSFLPDYAKRMARFLASVTIGDDYPLLNDSSPEMAPAPAIIFAAASKAFPSFAVDPTAARSVYHPDFGIYLYRSSKLSFFIDVGPLGPDFLLGHAHNDTLSFSVAFAGVEFVTDSGVFEYTTGKWRTYFRSACAHNVVTIDDQEPNEIWKSFRVGRRGYPCQVRCDPTNRTIEAGHTSYERLGVKLQRKVRILQGDEGVEITDTVTSTRRKRKIVGRLHLAPQTEIVGPMRGQEGTVFHLSRHKVAASIIVPDSGFSTRIGTSWYSARFGEKVERPCLVFEAEAETLQLTVLISCGHCSVTSL